LYGVLAPHHWSCVQYDPVGYSRGVACVGVGGNSDVGSCTLPASPAQDLH
jgi:hypothetical protein